MRATLLGLSLVVWSVGACTQDPAVCGPSDGGGVADGGPDVIVPPGCDLTKSVKDSTACLDDAIGIFVAPSGDDGAPGGKTKPVRTIGKALDLATSRGLPRVYVCEGTYDAAAEIKAPVSVHGGFSCAWAYTGAKPKLAPAKGIALRVTKVSGAVLLTDLEIIGSADATTPGDSAIAAFVAESADVTFRDAVLTAGSGVSAGIPPATSNWSGLAKDGAGAANGGLGAICACLDGTTSSSGGDGGAIAMGGKAGTAVPALGVPNGGGGGDTCLPGGAGATGVAAAAGTGATRNGSLTAQGWTNAADAAKGGAGSPAQGGGGGGGRTAAGGGGGGGCGGCGGAGGLAGTSGGSSFGLLAFNAVVNVSASVVIKSGAGGMGGQGGAAQNGQSGGAGGPGVCDGGSGGQGAGGSGGGGGAGGHSVPIGFVGSEPRVTNATLAPGTKGSGGVGGQSGGGAGAPGLAGLGGADGKAQPTLGL